MLSRATRTYKRICYIRRRVVRYASRLVGPRYGCRLRRRARTRSAVYPFGVRYTWRPYRRSPLAVVFSSPVQYGFSYAAPARAHVAADECGIVGGCVPLLPAGVRRRPTVANLKRSTSKNNSKRIKKRSPLRVGSDFRSRRQK